MYCAMFAVSFANSVVDTALKERIETFIAQRRKERSASLDVKMK